MSQYLEGLLEAAKQNDVLDDEEIQKLVLAAGLSGNQYLQDSVGKAVLGKSVQHWRYPFNQEDLSGEVELGETFQSRRFLLPRGDLTKHLLVVGQSGSGKTTLFYNLMYEVEKPFWAFDLKQDYRHLIQGLEHIGDILSTRRICPVKLSWVRRFRAGRFYFLEETSPSIFLRWVSLVQGRRHYSIT